MINTKGLDLSQFQAGISMESVRRAGNSFVILRGGLTGWGKRMKYKDEQFETFYKAAKSVGLNVGCYYYSCANTYQGGIDEANFLYQNCLKGKQFEMPIYIDIEEQRWQANKVTGVTDAIIGFCETLEKLGYFVGVYSSTWWFDNYIDTKRLSAYTKWVADWRTTKPAFVYNAFDMWQNSDSGKVGGYQVDTNICYRDFPTIIKAAGLNGFTAEKIPEKKSVKEIALECIEGKWGAGAVRKRQLTNAGYDYDEVQKMVNDLLTEVYVVKKDDNLTKIAKKHNTTVSALVKLNNLKNPDLLFAGQVLRIK